MPYNGFIHRRFSMPQLTEKQVLQLAGTQDIWKVLIRESEQGWGSDSWYQFFDSYEEAYTSYMEINKDNPTDHVPDYYMFASAPEKVVLSIK
jgi:hypothetical protein